MKNISYINNRLRCYKMLLMPVVLAATMLFSITAFSAAQEPAAGGVAAAVDATAAGGADVALDTAAGGTEEAAAVTAGARAARSANRAGTTAVAANALETAEKMYYCGELYVFSNSMIKINYEMASIAAGLKEIIQSGVILKSESQLNELIKIYNAAGESYNSWVDVKADLEYYIDKIGSRNSISKSQLQIAFKRTLTSINTTQGLLETAQAYRLEQSPASKRELISNTGKLIASASSAADTIYPHMQKALAGYRKMFDSFVEQTGLKLEYKTWQNPEA